MDKALTDQITLVIAVIGAVLGVLNYWRNWSQDRVRLSVRASFAQDEQGVWYIGVVVLNLSSFPLTITSIGFHELGSKNRLQPLVQRFVQGERLPVRLEPRTSCTSLTEFRAFDKSQLRVLKNAYAATACGSNAKSGGSVFRDVRDFAATP